MHSDARPRPPSDPAFRPVVVLWGFPELSQTFIHRELIEWTKAHPALRILAGKRVARGDGHPEVQRWITERALFLPSPWIWGPRGLLRALAMPVAFARAALWMARLPHKSLAHRLRALAMGLAAADVLPRLRALRPDYLHAHFASYNTEWTLWLARFLGVPYGASFHAVDIWKDGNILGDKIRGAAVVLTCTAFNHARLAQEAGDAAPKVRLAYHGIDFARLPEPKPLPARARFVAVGRMVEKKGFHHLIEALARLHAEGLDFEAELIGEGPEAARLEALARARGLAAKATFSGALPNAEVLARVGAATCLVMPSIRTADGNIDGIPNVILEAMALGRAVVGTDFSGIPEAVKPGETGLLVPPGDVVALAAALKAMALDPEGAARMGAAARAAAREGFDAPANAARQLAMIHAALAADP